PQPASPPARLRRPHSAPVDPRPHRAGAGDDSPGRRVSAVRSQGRRVNRLVPLVAPFLVSFTVALGATLLCERIARRAGLVVRPRDDRWHRRPTPLLGGLAIVLGTLPSLAWTGPSSVRFGAAVVVALVMAGIGLYDDVRPLRPPVKLVAQIVVAAVLVQIGFQLRLTRSPLVNLFLTLFWIVGITNALNL